MTDRATNPVEGATETVPTVHPVDEDEGIPIPQDPRPDRPTEADLEHARDERVAGATTIEGPGGGTRFFGAHDGAGEEV